MKHKNSFIKFSIFIARIILGLSFSFILMALLATIIQSWFELLAILGFILALAVVISVYFALSELR